MLLPRAPSGARVALSYPSPSLWGGWREAPGGVASYTRTAPTLHIGRSAHDLLSLPTNGGGLRKSELCCLFVPPPLWGLYGRDEQQSLLLGWLAEDQSVGSLRRTPKHPPPALRATPERALLVSTPTSGRDNRRGLPHISLGFLHAKTHTAAISPRISARVSDRARPSETSEGAGNAGRSMRPQPRMQNRKAYELVTTGSPETSGIPRAMVLRLIT